MKIYLITGRYSTTTYIEIKLSRDANQKMKIYRETYASKVGKIIGLQDIEIGNYEFDKSIILKGSDENFVRKLLSYEFQVKTLDMINKYKTIIHLKNDLLTIILFDTFKDEKSSDELIDYSLRLTDKIEEIQK